MSTLIVLIVIGWLIYRDTKRSETIIYAEGETQPGHQQRKCRVNWQ